MRVTMTVAMVAAFAGVGVVRAEEAPIGIALEFNDPGELTGAMVSYYQDATAKHLPDRVKAAIGDGCLHLDCTFKPEDKPGAGFVGWGKGWYWDTAETRPFEPVDLVKHPFVEVRYRTRGPTGWQLYYEVRTHGGRNTGGYLSMGGSPKGFATKTFRMNHESGSPQKWTPVKLMGLAPGLSVNPKPVGLDVDYIRVRGFTAAETQAEKPRAERLARYKVPPVPKWAQEQFVFGPWSTGPSDWWFGGIEGMFGDMARNHMNIIPREASQLTTDPAQVVVAARRAAKVAHRFGIKTVRRTWWPGRLLDRGASIGAVERYVKTVTAGLKGVPGLVGWNIIDEPAAQHIWKTLGPKQMLEEQDPDRIVLFPINGLRKAEIALPYSTITISDQYPIKKGTGRDPWQIGKFCRDISLLSDRPHWFIPQTAGKTDPSKANPGDYLFPTDEEWRLMVYLAVANGVKGITMWETCSTIWGGMWDRVGNECAIMPTIREVGERLVTVGPLIVRTGIDEKPPVSVETDQQDPKHGLSVGVLVDRHRKVRYLVVVNESVTEAQAGRIVCEDKSAKLFDLYILSRVDDFRVVELAPGDGRIYLLADEKAFGADRKTVLANRVAETLRAMKPDLSIARRWQMDLSKVEALIERGRAGEARDLLAETMAGHKPYSDCKKVLEAAAKDFARSAEKIYRLYMHTPRKGIGSMPSYAEMLAGRLSFLRERVIRGDREGLLDDLQAHHAWQNGTLPR